MKFGQLIEHPEQNIFFKIYAENEAGKLVPDQFLFFEKALYQVKASGLQLDFNSPIFQQPYISIALKLAYNRKNCLNFYPIDQA